VMMENLGPEKSPGQAFQAITQRMYLREHESA